MNETANFAFDASASPQNQDTAPVAPLLNLGDALSVLLDDARAAHEAKRNGTLRGPVSGLSALDREIAYAFAPGLHGMHGNAGTGKTALALQIASSCGFPALYVSCEMGAAELLRRHTARVTQTFLGRFKSGELSPQECEDLVLQAIATAPDLSLLDATIHPASPARIVECADVVRSRTQTGQMLLIVDSLQSWAEGIPSDASEYQMLNEAIKALRGIAHTLRVPIIFISERNRDSMKSGGLNAGAGTRKIEYGTESVIDLDREANVKEDGNGEVEVKLRLSKNRHGTTGREIPLRFCGALQRFRELTTDERLSNVQRHLR